MPYAPGVQDISGQLRAQGIAQAGQAWSQAIGNIGKSVTDAMQTYKQNQYLTNQALGKFTAATQADPSLLRFLESGGEQQDPNAPKVPISPEVLKAYSNIKSGKSDVYDAGLLGTMADTWVKTKQDAMQMQHLALQNQLIGAQLGQMGASEEAYKAALARQAAKVSPQAQMPAEQPQQAPQAPSQPAYGIPAVALARFGQPQVAPAGEASVPAGVGQFVAPQGLKARSGLSESAPWSENNPIGVINAQDIQDEMVIQNRGKPVTGDKVAAEVDRRVKMKQAALERSDIKLGTQEVPSNEGRILNVIDTRTGDVIGFRPNPQHPDVAGQITDQQEQSKIRTAATGKLLDQDIETGKAARQIGVPIARLSSLLQSGELKTGAGQDFMLAARGVAKSLGIPVDETQLAAGNEAVSYFGNLVRPIWAEQKGAISNQESEFYKSLGPQMAKDPRANAALIRVIAERIKTDQQLERNALDFTAGDLTAPEYAKKRKAILQEFDSRIPQIAKMGGINQPSENETRLTTQVNPDGTVSASSKPQYSVGTVVRQGGKSYQFDGTNWNEVK